MAMEADMTEPGGSKQDNGITIQTVTMGMVIGVGLGVALGVAMGDTAVGLVAGIAIGVALALAWSSLSNRTGE
jgi:uncharacterized membrane protein YgaE (UPF0421/DUF939 family)